MMISIKIKTNSLDIEGAMMMALSVHNALRGIPVAVKIVNGIGALIENGKSLFYNPECKALNVVFSGDPVQQIRIVEGKYMGVIMFAAAILNNQGQRVAAIGVIDAHGTLSLGEFVSNDDYIDRQVCGTRTPR
jgi:hypothetical protein